MTCGRLSVIVATLSATEYRMVSLMNSNCVIGDW